jgi:hypothetical protein
MDYHVHGTHSPRLRFTKEELKQRITEYWEEISLAELHVESPLDRGKRDVGLFVEKTETEDQSIIFSPRLSSML